MCFFWKSYKVAECVFCQSPAKMIWHFAVGKANNWQKAWNAVIMAADKTGIPHSASGHHDDSTLCSTLRWWRPRDDGRWLVVALVTGERQTVAGRRWWQTLFSTVLYPRPPFLSPSPSSSPLPAVLQNKSRDKCRSVSVSMDTRGAAAKTAAKPFHSRHCAWRQCSSDPRPPRPPSHYTLLDSLGSADRCSVKHALIHKTHSVFTSWGCYDLL